MKIVTTRRIAQIFFLVLFLWFSIASTLGEKWWQLRGWPVNLFLQLDPLVGLGTFITTRTFYSGLIWSIVTIVLTIILGRFFFCFLCPFGAIHQFVGFLGKRKKTKPQKSRVNAYHKAQSIKYIILTFLLSAAAIDFLFDSDIHSNIHSDILSSSLQIGLLDPIPLLHRSVNLVLLPLMDEPVLNLSPHQRYYETSWIIGSIFLAAVILNLVIPRFYCRYICPLGALLGVLSRFSLWRIGQRKGKCTDCKLCETDCEGACEPGGAIRISECVLCMNCLHTCPDDLVGFSTKVSVSGETVSPDIERRELIAAVISSAVLIPSLRLSGHTGPNWNPNLIRPPGSLDESAFLSRCIKCGQCMRVCPTNIIQPTGLQAGIEGIWTPTLNFRIGTSGCQLNCIACGNVCPTAAIRPISLDEKLGKKKYTEKGPIKIGTAFVDRNRCLPWAMNKPCIVCQENCPVSPKAIYTKESFERIRTDEDLRVESADTNQVFLENDILKPNKFGTGDYFIKILNSHDTSLRLVSSNTANSISIPERLSWQQSPQSGNRIDIFVRVQKPFVDPEKCIGCGVCEHECPITGKRAIRVSRENESRNKRHKFVL
ncbi:MAG: 4Fe-4S binding protein [Deltaproteobacteria bacterium]|nr:4Fe-4S binding protein [Deltaproteobacteria bacterium]